MAFRYDDRVKVTASNPGTGAIPAASPAAAGAYVQLSAITNIANGDIIPYAIDDGVSLFEDGYGTWNSTTGLARTTVKRNSSGNTSNINFTGAVTVRCSAITASLSLKDQNGNSNQPANCLELSLSTQAAMVASTYTAIPFDTVVLDTQSGWSVSNKRYTPTVAGKYFFMGCTSGQVASNMSFMLLALSKNGAASTAANILNECVTNNFNPSVATTLSATGIASAIVSMNGSTDYIELDALVNGSGGSNAVTGDAQNPGRTRLLGFYLGT